jgi:hypothetical protein
MIDVDLRTETVTTRERTVRLTGSDIVELLKQELKAQGVKGIPTGEVSVTFQVPGGGDWSHSQIDIDESCPVVVRWTEKEEG